MRNVSRNLAALALMLVAASAGAQNSTQVQATVPFAFEVAGQVMPAGDYRFSLNLANNTVIITGAHANSVAFLSGFEGRLAERKSYLRFERVGSDWSLFQIAFSGSAQRVPLAARKNAAHGDEVAIKNQLLLPVQ